MDKKIYQDIEVLVLDSGGNYVNIAEYLTDYFGKVYYYCPNYAGTPTLNKSMIGENLKDVIVVEQWKWKWNDYKAEDGGYDFQKIGLFLFADCYAGDDQMLLTQLLGKTVWGSRKAEELELLRYETKLKLAEIGLPVTPTKLFENFDELYEYLAKEDKPKFIKLSWFRGIMESAKFENMRDSIGIIANLKKSLEECYADKGKNAMELIVEDPVDADIEFGVDSFCVDGIFPNEISWGIEIKNKCYVSKHCSFDELPEQLQYTTFGLSKLIKEYGVNGCRCNVATEVRVDKKTEEGHLIDISMRFPCPPSEGHQMWIKNLPQIFMEGAKGISVEPEFTTKYMVQVAIYSGITADKQEIAIPKEIKPYVKLMNYCGTEKDKYGIIPELVTPAEPTTEIGYIVYCDDSIDKCFEKIEEISKKIEGEHLEYMFDAKKDAEEEIKKMKKLKIDF